MSKTLDEIRKKLQALDTRKAPQGPKDKTVYPHWDIQEGTSSLVRFLPDANTDNTFFWAERQLIKLPFPGILGQDEHKAITIQVPCVEMWDGKNTCPILNEVRPWWKDPSLEDTARKYWSKKTYYMQGFVKQDPMNETDAPENPIRKFIIGPQIFAIIKAALLDPDMENSPVDFINGTDFYISKTSKGGYADYGTSKWARRESSLDENMLDAIEQHGLVDLSTYLPKKPTPEQLGIIYDMFQDSLDGKLYDPEKYAQHYKPFGFDSGEDSGNRTTSRVQVPVSRPVKLAETVVESDDEADDAPFETVKTAPKATDKVVETVSGGNSSNMSTAGKSPAEILSMLRNRNKS